MNPLGTRLKEGSGKHLAKVETQNGMTVTGTHVHRFLQILIILNLLPFDIEYLWAAGEGTHKSDLYHSL